MKNGAASKRPRCPKCGEPLVATQPLLVPGVVADRIVTIEEVQQITGLPPSSARAAESRGQFPRSRRVGARRRGWLLSELVAWLRALPVLPLPEPRQKSGNEDNGTTTL